MADLGDIGNFIIHADLLDALRVPVVIGQIQSKKLKSQDIVKRLCGMPPMIL